MEVRRLTAELRASLANARELEKQVEEGRDNVEKAAFQAATLVERLNAVRGHNEVLAKQFAKEKEERLRVEEDRDALRKMTSLLEVQALTASEMELAVVRLEGEKKALEDEVKRLRGTRAASENDIREVIEESAVLLSSTTSAAVDRTTDPGAASTSIATANNSRLMATETAFSRAMRGVSSPPASQQRRRRRVSVDMGVEEEEEQACSDDNNKGEASAERATAGEKITTFIDVDVKLTERGASFSTAVSPEFRPLPICGRNAAKAPASPSPSRSPLRSKQPWRAPGPASPLASPIAASSSQHRHHGSRRCSTCSVDAPAQILISPSAALMTAASPTSPSRSRGRTPAVAQASESTKDKKRIRELESQLEEACRLAVLNATEAVKKERGRASASGRPVAPPAAPPPQKLKAPPVLLVALPVPESAEHHHHYQRDHHHHRKEEKRHLVAHPHAQSKDNEQAAIDRAEAALQVMEKAKKLREALAGMRSQKSAAVAANRQKKEQVSPSLMQQTARTTSSQVDAAAASERERLAPPEPSTSSIITAQAPLGPITMTGGWQPRPLGAAATIATTS
jgi:hypothetical protein